MKYFSVFLSVFLLCSYADCSWCAEIPSVEWESSYTKTPPTIDGKVDEIWGRTKPLAITVREAIGGVNPRQVVLCALHSDNTFYVMAQWPDDTKSDMRDPYIRNAEKKAYERPSKPDDKFALEFPMTGDFNIRMITLAHEYVADVRHWKAGRGSPVGWVDDKRITSALLQFLMTNFTGNIQFHL